MTSAALSQSNEIAFGGLMDNNGPSFTESSGFTTLTNLATAGQSGIALSYQTVATTTAVTYAPTLGTAQSGISLISTFKGN